MVDSDGYPVYRRRDSGNTVEKNGVVIDNRFVVPYNAKLLLKYQAHINVEWCNQSHSIKYLFKYINKGHDRVTATFVRDGEGVQDGTAQIVDEVKNYVDCRYVSPCEEVWRLYGFDIHYRKPPVEILSFHLENQQTIVYRDKDSIDAVVNRPGIEQTMFLAWMDCNKTYAAARNLMYVEFPNKFVWKSDIKMWLPRRKGFYVGRIHHFPIGSGKIHYLGILLNKVKGATCYEDIRTVNELVYNSFQDTCFALGLLDDDKEYIDGIKEASFWQSTGYLRSMFSMLLMSNSLSRPESVWEETWEHLSDDVLSRQRQIIGLNDLRLNETQIRNFALVDIERIMNRNGSSLRMYPGMPFPDNIASLTAQNKLIQDELCYDSVLLRESHNGLFTGLNNEQRDVYDTIMSSVYR